MIDLSYPRINQLVIVRYSFTGISGCERQTHARSHIIRRKDIVVVVRSEVSAHSDPRNDGQDIRSIFLSSLDLQSSIGLAVSRLH